MKKLTPYQISQYELFIQPVFKYVAKHKKMIDNPNKRKIYYKALKGGVSRLGKEIWRGNEY